MACPVGNLIQFRFDVGNGVQNLEKETSYPLNDNFWHLVHVERNRKQAMLRVDQQAPLTLDEKTDEHFRVLNLDSPLVIGTCCSSAFPDGDANSKKLAPYGTGGRLLLTANFKVT